MRSKFNFNTTTGVAHFSCDLYLFRCEIVDCLVATAFHVILNLFQFRILLFFCYFFKHTLRCNQIQCFQLSFHFSFRLIKTIFFIFVCCVSYCLINFTCFYFISNLKKVNESFAKFDS